MGFKKMFFGIAKEMDKQRYKEMDRRQKAQQKEQERQQELQQLSLTLKSHLDAVLDPYNAWVEEFAVLEEQYQNFEITGENIDEFLEIHDTVIAITQQTIKQLELVPQAYDLPKVAQQYVKDMKENFIQSLHYRVMHSLSTKAGLFEVLEHGEPIEHTPEVSNGHLQEAINFADAAAANMNRAIQSVQ